MGASNTNFTTVNTLASQAVALKMYLNDTFTTLKMDDMGVWMKVVSCRLHNICRVC
jgi:carbamoyl-phosphate synthase/aspartate carbamoyltransferase/dihydroorotase